VIVDTSDGDLKIEKVVKPHFALAELSAEAGSFRKIN